MIAVTIIYPAFSGGGRGDTSRKACGYFHWLRKSGKSEWPRSCENLLVAFPSCGVSAGNPEGIGSWASLVDSSKLVD